jgi:hypothetical protein
LTTSTRTFFDSIVSTHDSGLGSAYPQRPEFAEEVVGEPDGSGAHHRESCQRYDFVEVDTTPCGRTTAADGYRHEDRTGGNPNSCQRQEFCSSSIFDKMNYPPDKTLFVNRVEDGEAAIASLFRLRSSKNI